MKHFILSIATFSLQGNARVYTCQYCSHEFHHISNFKRHVMLHTGDSPYYCQQCNKGFVRRDAYVKHMNQRHSSPSNTEYQQTNQVPAPSYVTEGTEMQ